MAGGFPFPDQAGTPLAAPPEAGREADGLLAGLAAEHCADAAGPEGRPRRPI